MIPYFGTLPVYWPLTLHTMGRNPALAWHLFTDQDLTDLPPNVTVTRTTLPAMRDRISRTLGYEAAIANPYKLCDLKPAYGLIFEPELEPYEYWAYADVDVIWGDIWAHVSEAVEAGTERILTFGHLSMFRNTPELRTLVLQDHPGVVPAHEAFTTEAHLSYDEFGGWDAITRAAGLSTFADPVCFDMFVPSYRLRANRSRRGRGDTVFAWQDGRCLELDPSTGAVLSEAAYIHLQKRAVRRPAALVPPAPPGALAFGPVDITPAESLQDAARISLGLERSVSSWVHWRRHYDTFRLKRALRRLQREVRALADRRARDPRPGRRGRPRTRRHWPDPLGRVATAPSRTSPFVEQQGLPRDNTQH